jgi:hypothetical protein
MAAKRKYAPPKPDPNRPWSELTKAEQNAAYSRALYAYSIGEGPNPQTQGQFFRERSAAQPKG